MAFNKKLLKLIALASIFTFFNTSSFSQESNNDNNSVRKISIENVATGFPNTDDYNYFISLLTTLNDLKWKVSKGQIRVSQEQLKQIDQNIDLIKHSLIVSEKNSGYKIYINTRSKSTLKDLNGQVEIDGKGKAIEFAILDIETDRWPNTLSRNFSMSREVIGGAKSFNFDINHLQELSKEIERDLSELTLTSLKQSGVKISLSGNKFRSSREYPARILSSNELLRILNSSEYSDPFYPVLLIPKIIFENEENFKLLIGENNNYGSRQKNDLINIRSILNNDQFILANEVSLNQLLSFKLEIEKKKENAVKNAASVQIKHSEELKSAIDSNTVGVGLISAYKKLEPISSTSSRNVDERLSQKIQLDRSTKICTSAMPQDIRVKGAIITETLLKWVGSEGKIKNYSTYTNINDVYKELQTGNCATIIDDPKNIQLVYKELAKNSNYIVDLGPFIPFETVKNPYAKSLGFVDWSGFDLASRIKKGKTTNDQILTLSKYGITKIDDFYSVSERMNKSGYDSDPNPSATQLISFLNDEAEAKNQGKSLKNLLATKEKEAQAAADNHIKKYPYEAILSCGTNRHFNIYSCFSGSKYSPDTELIVKNDGRQVMYKIFNLRSAGIENSDGLHIYLTDQFYILAQNASAELILGLTIINRSNRKIIYENQASKFAVVQARR